MVDLSSNNLGDQAASELALAIKSNHGLVLEELNLENNFVTDRGAGSLCESVTKNHSIIWINLALNQCSPEMLNAIEALPLRPAVQSRIQQSYMYEQPVAPVAAVALGPLPITQAPKITAASLEAEGSAVFFLPNEYDVDPSDKRPLFVMINSYFETAISNDDPAQPSDAMYDMVIGHY